MRSVPFFHLLYHWRAASCFADETAKAAAGSPRRGRNQHPLAERRRVVHGLHQQLTSYGSTYGKFGGIVVALPSSTSLAQLQKDLTKVPDAELKEHFAAISALEAISRCA
jgi:hypothetical protein